MIDLIVSALQDAFVALESENEDELDFGYHYGVAAGIAAAAGVFGVKALEMCDDLSDAYEDLDFDFMRYILREASERPDSGNEHYARTRETEIHALELGAALGAALRAQEDGDVGRYCLMMGFTVGLMFRYEDSDDGAVGAVRAKIISGYETDSDDLLQQAQGTLAFGARMSDPMGLIGKEESARYYEERMRTMRWVQNFGLREARSKDEAVVAPNSLSINYQLTQQAGEEDVENESDEFFHEEDLMPVEDDEGDSLTGDPEAAAHVSSGIAKQKNGDYDGAIADFDCAIAIDPDNVEAVVNRAVCKQDKDDHIGAIADWDRALELKPDDGGWYVNRGMVKEIIGDIDGAIADFSRAAELEPDYEVAYIARAYNRNKQGDYEGAIADYDRVIELWPDNNGAAFDDRGVAKTRLARYDDAITDFNRAIELQPSNAGYYLNRGTAKANAKDYPGASDDFARAIELYTDHARDANEARAIVANTVMDSPEDSQMAAQEAAENPPRPIEMCYWVAPGKLLAGEYPGHWEEGEAKEKLALLTDVAGVSVFIDLTDPATTDTHLKPYANLLDGPSHLRFAIRDQSIPASPEFTKQTLDAIDAHIAAGRTVYVHCWGGVGRTGTIIGCWLARHYEPGHAALGRLTELWQENPKSHTRCSPETGEQVRYVLDWNESDA
ncbi:MAG: tetratricopeptide repeat protein [Chloroflexota bacterium]|nr:tetratricopeptide repeat protein [Chloroflexota bacterium]